MSDNEVTLRVRTLEEHSINAWPALEAVLYDGWIIRAARGYTHRANSVQTLYPSALSLDEKFTRCELFYYARHQPCVFKLTSATQPTDLDTRLEARGYTAHSLTDVCTLDLTTGNFTLDIEPLSADIRPYPSYNWLDQYATFQGIHQAQQHTLSAMMSDRLVPHSMFILLWDRNEPVGAAQIVVEAGYAGLFSVIVRSDRRGRGFGRTLTQLALWEAQKANAHTAYLMVEQNNAVAHSLYDSFGFQPLYQYWYREL